MLNTWYRNQDSLNLQATYFLWCEYLCFLSYEYTQVHICVYVCLHSCLENWSETVKRTDSSVVCINTLFSWCWDSADWFLNWIKEIIWKKAQLILLKHNKIIIEQWSWIIFTLSKKMNKYTLHIIALFLASSQLFFSFDHKKTKGRYLIKQSYQVKLFLSYLIESI